MFSLLCLKIASGFNLSPHATKLVRPREHCKHETSYVEIFITCGLPVFYGEEMCFWEKTNFLNDSVL